jgi:hypothetical protein
MAKSAAKNSSHSHYSTLEAYDRKISSDSRTITSTCQRCGLVFRGTVDDGLAQRELDHLLECVMTNPA